MNRLQWPLLGRLFARDLRIGRAALIGVILLALLPVVRFFQPTLLQFGSDANLSVVIPFGGAIIGALACFRDMPATPRAWWASQPISGSAMAISKLAAIVIFAIAMALATGVGAALYGLDTASVLNAALTVGFSVVCAGVAGMAMALAVVARGAGAFGALLVLALVGSKAVIAALGLLSNDTVFLSTWAVGAVVLAAGIAAIRWHYTQREASVPGRAGILLVGVMVMAYAERPPHASTTPRAAYADTPVLDLDPAQPLSCSADGSVTLGVRSRVAGRQVVLADPTLVVTLRDGSTRTLRAPRWYQVVGTWGPLVASGASKTLGDAGEAATRTSWILFEGQASARDSVCARTAKLALDLAVSVREAREIARLPLQVAASGRVNGYRFSLSQVHVDGPQSELTMQTSALAREAGGEPSTLANLRFAILQPQRDELIRLQTETGGHPDVVNRDLPGLRHEGARFSLAAYSREALPAAVNQDWFAGSVVIVSQVAETGARRQQLSVDLPQVTAARRQGSEH